MPRITTEEELNALVERCVAVLPAKTEVAVNKFLDVMMTKFDKASNTDAHLNLRDCKMYLPYKYNIAFVARMHASVRGTTKQSKERSVYDI